MSELFPGELAAADQELASVDARVSELVDEWRHAEGWYAGRLDRVCAFMSESVVASRPDARALVAMLAVAVERLAAR